MKQYYFAWFVIIPLLLSSCTTSGTFISSHRTSVELSDNNYNIVTESARGSSEATYLFGVSYSYGIVSQSISVARISGSPFLYQEALDDLWDHVYREYGDIKGEQLALTNVRYDSDILNLFLVSKIKLSVRADVIRFTD